MPTASTGRRVAAAVLLVAALVLGAWPTHSHAAFRQKQGWWWRAQTGLVDLPAPESVPSGGVAVGRTVDGPSAIAAAAFELSADETAPVLALTVAGDVAGDAAALVACPPEQPWAPAASGAWSERPSLDCDSGHVDGVRTADGAQWIFDLSTITHSGILDVVIAPSTDSAPFELTFEAITSESLTTVRVVPTTAPPPPATAPPPAPSGPAIPAPVFVPPTTPPPSFSPAPPATPAPAAPTPRLDPVPTPAPARPVDQPVGRVSDPRRLGIFVLVMAAALIAMTWGQETRAPIPLGAMGHRHPGRLAVGVEAHGDRGVGRFRRRRAGPPPRLW
ncbi:MAG TPA: hypothetical protein VGA13_07445 [Acidimicrobiales bacterium]